ncbi:MAG: M14 family zinc carboxypeptidase [Bacteriovoracaceae bacterium]
MTINNLIPEIHDLEQLNVEFGNYIRFEKLTDLSAQGLTLPMYALSIGTQDPKAPVFGLFGGVHGLEKVGSHVLISFLKTLLHRMTWDKEWINFFEHCRFVSIPVVNPIGMALNRRSNGNGIDLMRNSPVEASGKLIPLISGHRLGNWLPWYRGIEGMELETELKIVMEYCHKEFFQSQHVITLDLHSGFGLKDRLWYPWASNKQPFPHEPEVLNLKKIFENSFPYHIYTIEHQSLNYSNHGDLWDWIYKNYSLANPNGKYLPLTLEMGSWMWVKKNFWQLSSFSGLFNPIKKHRFARTMRRHNFLLEFLLKVSRNHHAWSK